MFNLTRIKQTLERHRQVATKKNLKKRLSKLQEKLASDEAILLSDYHDIYYFSEYQQLVPEEREAFLLICQQQSFLIHASFSPAPQHHFLINLKGAQKKKLQTHLIQIQQVQAFKKLFIDESSLGKSSTDTSSRTISSNFF